VVYGPDADAIVQAAAGATVVREPYQPGEAPEAWIATFADPDDNDFSSSARSQADGRAHRESRCAAA
jgi:predicted enzyme related to lactoylglutathione lyase